MKLMTALLIILLFPLVGCDFNSTGKCIDSKKYLWDTNINDNRYVGNERYWDAVKSCK